MRAARRQPPGAAAPSPPEPEHSLLPAVRSVCGRACASLSEASRRNLARLGLRARVRQPKPCRDDVEPVRRIPERSNARCAPEAREVQSALAKTIDIAANARSTT
jgi:hypothetical protein